MSWLKSAVIDEDYEKQLQEVEERGQRPVTKYDPEYQWMLALIKAVVREGVKADEIDKILTSHPFRTIDDVGDAAAQVWTLATTKYRIPSDWLEKQLPEKKLKNKG